MTIAAAIQMNSTDDVKINLHNASKLLQKAADAGAELVVLPENFALMSNSKSLLHRETMGSGPVQEFLAHQAEKLSLWIVGGTLPLNDPASKKMYAASLVYNEKGVCIAHYNKIHLFDAKVSDQESHQESLHFIAGNQLTVIDSPIGKLGIAICYDIRFPELFRLMLKQGAEIFAVPAAFTVPTGQAHWKTLTRTRAIENQCYLIASCQTGTHTNGRKTYGRSLIIDPWGKLLTVLPTEPGVITANIDLAYLQDIRQKMPVQSHQKLI